MAGQNDSDTDTNTDTGEAGAAPDTSSTETGAAGESTLLDAINEGIAEASPNRSASADEGTEEGADDTKTGEEETPAGEAGATAPDGETRQRDEHGRFIGKPKEGDPAAAAKAAGDKAAKPAEGEAKPAAKQPDPVNDPIPDDVKGKTRERMETLIKTAKEVTAARDQAVADREELLSYVADTKATPQQFTDALQYLKAINSGDPAQIRQAIKVVQSELVALARRIGEPVPGVDLLAEHQDLKDAIEAGDLSQQHAQEIAAARAMRGQQQQASQHQSEQQRVQQAVNDGRTALNALDTQLKTTDPQYAAKRAILVPMLQPIFAQLHPSKWAGAFKEAYDKLPATAIAPAPAPPPPNGQQRPTQQQQPLRARQPAGQTAKAPGSLLDAINAGIEAAGR